MSKSRIQMIIIICLILTFIAIAMLFANNKKVETEFGNYENKYDKPVEVISEKNEDGTYNILSKIIEKLCAYKVRVLGDIFVDVISNSGEVLYTLCFTKCIFSGVSSDGFSYESTDLRRFYINFTYDNVHVLAPDEDLKKR